MLTLVRPSRRLRPPFFGGRAGRGSMCFELCRVDHHRLLLAESGSLPGRHPREDALIA